MADQYFVTCDCGQRIRVREDHFGKIGKCAKCRKPITITRGSATPIDAAPSAAPVAQSASTAAHRGKAVGPVEAVVADSGTVWEPGQVVLNEYVVERRLGEGGMGVVYLLVRSSSTGHRFAVKKTRFRDEASRRGFLAELQVWIDMPEHLHLAACRFFRTVEGELVIFAEYVEGGALSSWIDKRRLTRLDQILDVAIQSAWGLHAAHELGLVHQDMKPGNVLMTKESVAKLTDFGLARARARTGETPLGAPGGTPLTGSAPSGTESVLVSVGGMTPAYCSPEQAARRSLTRKTDLWSWGASVLEMFAGGVFWQYGPAVEQSLDAYLAEGSTEDGLPAMPSSVANILRQCFRPEPEKRWATLLEAAEALREVYRESVGRDYPRSTPAFPCASDRVSARHDRRQTDKGVTWEDPRQYLELALKLSGRDVREADTFSPRPSGGRKAQAIADLATYEEARQILEKLFNQGRKDVGELLAELCVNKAFVHLSTDDSSGAADLYDKAIAIMERLVNREGRQELAIGLATMYQNKAVMLEDFGDPQAAMALNGQAIAIKERLVNREGRKELAIDLAHLYHNKARMLQGLGDLQAAVALSDQAITILERLVNQEGRRELADDQASVYQNKASALSALGDLQAAVALFDQAIAIRERLVNREGRGELAHALSRTYHNKANALHKLGNLAAAVALYDQAILIIERLVNREGRGELAGDFATICVGKARTLDELEDFQAALALYDQAIAIYERLVNREGREELRGDLAKTMAYGADCRLSNGETDRGKAEARKAVQMLQEEIAHTGRGDLRRVLDWANIAFKNIL